MRKIKYGNSIIYIIGSNVVTRYEYEEELARRRDALR